MNIEEIRKKFPQYTDVPDGELVRGLHKTFYKDIPYERFLREINFVPTESYKDSSGNPNPQTLKAIEDISGKGFGTGIPKLAYDVGEKVTDFASKYEPMRGAPAAALGFGANVATQAVPALLGGRAMEASGAPELMRQGGRMLMQSATKPTLRDLQNGDAAKAIETMLKQGYNPTQGGVKAMQGKIDALRQEIDAALQSSTATVDKGAVASRLQGLLDKMSKQVNPGGDIRAVQDAWSEFLAHPLLSGKQTMPVQLAQEMKQGTYQALGDKPYGELAGASTEAQKQLARGLKEEISSAVPGVAEKNQLQAELLNARDIAQRRALTSDNRNPLSLAPLASGPGGFLSYLADKSDLVKSLLGRGLYSGSEAVPRTAGQLGGAVFGSQLGQQPTEDQLKILADMVRGQQ